MTVEAANRMRGAIWGMLVGDAYCLGSHWIYDAEAFLQRFPEGPEGFDPPAAGHYHAGKARGAFTNYGEGGLLLLETLAVDGVDADAYGRRLVAFYGRPDHRCYVDKPTRHLLEARAALPTDAPYAQGRDDAQNVTTSRLAPLVVALAGDPRLMIEVDRFTRVLQQNDRAVAYACAHARLLEQLLGGATLDSAVAALAASLDRRTPLGEEIARGLDQARDRRAVPVAEAAAQFGLSCPLVKAFPAALQAAFAHEDDLGRAIRATCLARGDNASRAMLVGAWLGARLGVEGVPVAWRRRLRDAAAIEDDVERLLAQRARSSLAAAH